jgi:hypothetical protein
MLGWRWWQTLLEYLTEILGIGFLLCLKAFVPLAFFQHGFLILLYLL